MVDALLDPVRRQANRAYVGQILDTLERYLCVYVTQVMADAGRPWAGDAKIVNCLRAVTANWEVVFKKDPENDSSMPKHYAHALRETRNRWAHSDSFSVREVRQVADAAALLALYFELPADVVREIDAIRLLAESARGAVKEDCGAGKRRSAEHVSATNQPTATGRPEKLDNGQGTEVIDDTSGLTADDVAMKRVLCPVCESKVFEEWPAGWDAHAASPSGCTSLEPFSPVERKAAFRRQCAHLFRPASERETMRRLYRWFAPDQARVVQEYVEDERCGVVRRGVNSHGFSAEDNAKRLLQEGLRKGWLRHGASTAT